MSGLLLTKFCIQWHEFDSGCSYIEELLNVVYLIFIGTFQPLRIFLVATRGLEIDWFTVVQLCVIDLFRLQVLVRFYFLSYFIYCHIVITYV